MEPYCFGWSKILCVLNCYIFEIIFNKFDFWLSFCGIFTYNKEMCALLK